MALEPARSANRRRLQRRHRGERVIAVAYPVVQLNRYQPKVLSRAQWDLARPSALALVLRATADTPVTSRSLLSLLANYLAWHPLWDRAVEPDLAALLAPIHIDAYVASSSRHRNAGAGLRRLARCVGAMPQRSTTPSKRPPVGATAFWRAVAGRGPLTALVSASRRCGRVLTPRTFTDVAGSLIDEAPDLAELVAGCAREGDAGTVSVLHDVAQTLRSLSDGEQVGGELSSRTARPSRTTKTSTRTLSRTAVLRQAREARRRREEARVLAEVGPRAKSLDELTAPLPAIEEAIAAFRPYRFSDADWSLVKETTRTLLRAYGPPSVTWVQTQAGVIARFCRWVATRPERIQRGEVLRADETLEAGLIDVYLAGPLANVPDSSRATARSLVRRATRNLSPLPTGSIAYHPVNPPYSPAECAAFLRLARLQPTAATRRGMSALVALGLGAGLSSQEQREVSDDRVHEVDLDGGNVLVVDVPGPRARRVVVRAPYDDLLREAITLHREQGRRANQPLYGTKVDRHNASATVTGSARTAFGVGVEIDPARLRSTWLVALMSADLPLGVLLKVSGLRSARTLVDLLPYCPEPSEEAVLAALRAAGERSVNS